MSDERDWEELLMSLMSLGKETLVTGLVDKEKTVGCFLNPFRQSKVDVVTGSALKLCGRELSHLLEIEVDFQLPTTSLLLFFIFEIK